MQNNSNVDLNVFDLSGKIVKQIQITNGLNSDVIIDVQHLEKGMYLMTLFTEGENQNSFYSGTLIKE